MGSLVIFRCRYVMRETGCKKYIYKRLVEILGYLWIIAFRIDFVLKYVCYYREVTLSFLNHVNN